MDNMPMNRYPKPNPFVDTSSGLSEDSTDYGDPGVMFVDEIEDDGAWVLEGKDGQRKFMPLSALPKGAKTGDSFTKDGRIMPRRRFDDTGLRSSGLGGDITL